MRRNRELQELRAKQLEVVELEGGVKTTIHKDVREGPKVLESVHENMVTFMQSSQEEYDNMWKLLQKFPRLVEKLGGKDVAAKDAKADQLQAFQKRSNWWFGEAIHPS